MNQYANNVRIAFRSNNTEAIIKFYQESPIITSSGDITGEESLEVASIAMHPDVVNKLRMMLNKVIHEVSLEEAAPEETD